jgi:hypothetical protein
MKRQILSVLTVVAIAAITTKVTFAAGGQSSQIKVVAANGNATIVFEPATDGDLEMGVLTRWSSFAQVHPKIARQLGNRPRLIDDPGYLRKHPETGEAVRGQSQFAGRDEAQSR